MIPSSVRHPGTDVKFFFNMKVLFPQEQEVLPQWNLQAVFHEHWDPPSLVHNLESSLVLLDKLDLIDVPPTEIHMCTMSLFNFSIARMSSIQFSCWIYRGVTINKALTFKLANEVECAALNHTGPRYPVRQLSKTQGEGEDISPWIKEESWNFLCTVWCLKAVMQRLIH